MMLKILFLFSKWNFGTTHWIVCLQQLFGIGSD